MGQHYHVRSGMGGGYLPDSSYRIDGLRAARAAMRDDVERVRFDDSEDGYVWERSGPDAWVLRSKMVRVRDSDLNPRFAHRQYVPLHSHNLGYYVKVVPCQETDCQDEE